jgi:hypothetical protein
MEAQIRQALQQINFIEQYKALSAAFGGPAPEEENLDKESTLLFFKNAGYKASFNKSEYFFKISLKKGDYKIQLNICPRYGMAELIFTFWHKGQMLSLGGPWDFICEQLGDATRILLPRFHNQEEWEQILERAIGIMEALAGKF